EHPVAVHNRHEFARGDERAQIAVVRAADVERVRGSGDGESDEGERTHVASIAKRYERFAVSESRRTRRNGLSIATCAPIVGAAPVAATMVTTTIAPIEANAGRRRPSRNHLAHAMPRKMSGKRTTGLKRNT